VIETKVSKPRILTGRQTRAVLLLAEDEDSDEAIASKVGVGRTTLWKWKAWPEFQEAVQQHCAQLATDLSRYHIARRDKRMKALNDRWERAKRVIDARAEEHKAIPGGDSGLLVRQIKVVGHGKDQVRIEEYVSDTGLMGEMRQTEKQAAVEAGQWSEKSEIKADAIIRQYVGVDLDDV
jgi:Helix-turn-helix of insertion element transposase